MTENEKNKEATVETEDWAIIPFDEAEDNARWAELIEETDKLIAEAAELESSYGKILTMNKLSDIKTKEDVPELEFF